MTAAQDISAVEQGSNVNTKKGKGLAFWLIILSICMSVFLSALELSSVSNALPTIVQDLQGENFVWVGSAYALASTAVLPTSGGLAEIFGRRGTMLTALATFMLGSALCGAAKSMNMLIVARAIQGMGGGGILSLSSIVLSDLVSLKERGLYNGLIAMTWGFSTAIGPLFGGGLAQSGNWRWLFYINIPITGISAALVVTCLRLRTPAGTLAEKLARVDWIGNLLVTASTVSCVIALTWAGIRYPWSSPKILVPLILGLVGLVVFMIYEARFAKHPIVPISLLANRTSLSGYIQTFINPIVSLAIIYYLPIYIQACKGHSPVRTGVDVLGLSLIMGPMLVTTSVSVTVTKAYRPQIWFGWTALSVATGLLCLLKADSSISLIVGLPILVGVGLGSLMSATYFPVLAPLPVTENAHALALFAFFRSFAGVWGITIGGTILQNQLSHNLPQEYLAQFPGGAEIAFSAIPTIASLPEPLRTSVRVTFANGIAKIWQVMTGVAIVGLLVSLLMRAHPLHTQVDEKWGMEQNSDEKQENAVATVGETVMVKNTEKLTLEITVLGDGSTNAGHVSPVLPRSPRSVHSYRIGTLSSS